MLGSVRVPNRFVRSATYEAMADHDGGVTPRLVKLYRTLGKSQIGTIISGVSFVCPEGKGPPSAMGIDRDDRIEGLELSAGGTCWAPFRMCRGDVPVEDLTRLYPWLLRPIARRRFRAMRERASFAPNCNAFAAKQVKEALGSVPLMLVGTFRDLDDMHELRAKGLADFISLSRPFVRQPTLVRRFAEGRSRAAACTSCNLCYAAVCHDLPLRCYARGLPRA